MSELVGRRALRDELRAVGFVPFESRLYRPVPGLVARTGVVTRVQASAGDVVVVTAPAGYGKSTFVAECVMHDPRPTAWISLTAAENDPAALLTYVALALEGIELVDPASVVGLWEGTPSMGSGSLQRFAAMFSTRRQSFTLVLDDVHELVGRDALDAVAVMVRELPAGSRLVLISRSAIALRFGRIRGGGRLVEVGSADLAFDEREAATLFAELGVTMSAVPVREVIDRTEGWPVALYLAALADRRGHGDVADVIAALRGNHRFLIDYLGEELLAELDADMTAFLLDASCLERLSGSLCDEVLRRDGSAELLERLRLENLLIIPLDERRQWYRLHHLLAEFLRSELDRRDPQRRAEVHRRASAWFEARGDADAAITHAISSGDATRAEALVTRWFGGLTTTGRSSTVDRWLALFPPDDLDRRPGLMLAAAHGQFRDGRGGVAVQWLDRAAAALGDPHPADPAGPVAPLLAVSRAIIAPLTPAEMAAEARYTYDCVRLGEGHPLACLALGAAAFMTSDEAEAQRRLRECLDSPLDRPHVKASAMAHLAVIEIEHGRWERARELAREAKLVLGPTSIRRPPGVLVLAVNVLVEARDHPAGDGHEDRARCGRSLIDLVGVAPWLNVQARIALARDALIRGDRVGAANLLEETETILAGTPDASGVLRQLATLRDELHRAMNVRAVAFGPTSLTTAELRVLQLLPTHLSFVEIGERLYLSRHTVKTQALSIYRRLGTSSRSGAVQIAIDAGLLPRSRALP